MEQVRAVYPSRRCAIPDNLLDILITHLESDDKAKSYFFGKPMLSTYACYKRYNEIPYAYRLRQVGVLKKKVVYKSNQQNFAQYRSIIPGTNV